MRCEYRFTFSMDTNIITKLILGIFLGPGHLALVVEMLQRECDRQAGRIVGEMRKHRRLDAVVNSVCDSLRY